MQMALIRERDGKRLHVKSRLMGESLVSKSFIEALEVAPPAAPLPGRQYPQDWRAVHLRPRRQSTFRPIIKEIVANKEKSTKC